MNKHHVKDNFSLRENFLINLLNKVITEYKNLLNFVKYTKPLKIVEIVKISSIPGETEFKIQVSHKDTLLQLSAAKIISDGYDLKDFSDFNSQLIYQAAQGKLIEFLKLSVNSEPEYRIISKKFDQKVGRYVFIIKTKKQHQFGRTAEEIVCDKNILNGLDLQDIYDVGYTQGSESILREKTALMLAKNKQF